MAPCKIKNITYVIDSSTRLTTPLVKFRPQDIFLSYIDTPDRLPGDKNSTRPLVIVSEILKGRVILPKQDVCFGKNYSFFLVSF